jgi:hypothetical protein
MKLKTFLKEVVLVLQKEKVSFALAGGMVASLYRQHERTTKDIDFLILSENKTIEKAKEIITKFQLKPTIIRKADLEGGPLFAIKRKSTEPYIVAGRVAGDSSKIGLDFILPIMPWFDGALERSQKNLIDFGFGAFPCLTVEDVIIAKVFAFHNSSKRFHDLDDLRSIFEAGHELDLAYIKGQLEVLNIKMPKEIKEFVPKGI